MGIGRNEVRRRARKGKVMQTNPTMVLERVGKSPRKR